MHLSGGRKVAIAALLVGTGGTMACDAVGPAPCARPQILASYVKPNPTNVLSAIVSSRVDSADSVSVRFGRLDSPIDNITPAVPSPGDSVTVPLLGLYDAANYSAQVTAFNRCGSSEGAILFFSTEKLPSDLPAYVTSGSDPSPGYVVFAALSYGVVIDNTGRVVWYRRFPGGAGLNFQPQPNGRYAARPASPIPGEAPRWVEVDPLGNVTRTLGCGRGLQARLHDLLAQPDGSYWILCDEIRTVDLSAQGGPAETVLLGTGAQHVSVTGDVLFDWSPFDHLPVDVEALDPNDRIAGAINWTHGNALDLDADGNLLMSFRNLSEIIKIDTSTGAVVWRMGGLRNQFTFENTAIPAFLGQHGVRATGPGQLMLVDNRGDPSQSHAERYTYDEQQHTVRMSGSYSAPAGVVGLIGGSTQNLPGGRTLVSFGNGGSVQEYDTVGNVVWKIEQNPGYIFRAMRIRSLYEPGIGDPR